MQPNLSITDFEAFLYVQYGMGREAGLADYSLEWLDIRPKVELRTGSPLLVPFVLTKSALVALVPKRLAQMMPTQAELKVIEPPDASRPSASQRSGILGGTSTLPTGSSETASG